MCICLHLVCEDEAANFIFVSSFLWREKLIIQVDRSKLCAFRLGKSSTTKIGRVFREIVGSLEEAIHAI